ncbi:MAG: hypothetical protein FD151_308 [bacterium]|jgi:UDP-N-acetylmuramate-alanine ligase|nr:MAG: hypothetical protein FD151_308 [bacterium]RJP57134.1 MAG: hypothetical protein C4549_05595 [Deltaproteobacteria bacterium]
MEEKDINLDFFKKFDNAKDIFSKILRKAKKEIILQDREEFVESMADQIMEDHGLTEDDANKYADLVYQIWEERCGCSITALDQEISAIKKKIF